jgi:hypothetical protein
MRSGGSAGRPAAGHDDVPQGAPSIGARRAVAHHPLGVMRPGPGAGEIGLAMSTQTPSVSRRRVHDRGAQRRDDRLRQRYGLLLAALVVSFAVQGIVPGGAGQEVLVTALVGTTLVLALRAGEVDPRLVAAAAAVAVILVVALAALAATGHATDQVARVAEGLLVVLAPPAVVVGVVRALREHGAVTVQAVLGVLCVYLLMGMFCASLYGAIDRLGGQPFFADGISATTSNCLYFSFTTLTTVGYGDLTARTGLGHTLAVSEALLGQIYLVTVVAMLVANLGRGQAGGAAR